MSSFGVLTSGFSQKTLDDIKTEIEEKQRELIASNLNQSSTSVLGQLNGIFSSKLAELWEVAAAVYRSEYPDTATGDALDNVAQITGVTRLAATSSTVTLTATGTTGTVLPIGRVASVSGVPTSRFLTSAAATIAAVSAWLATHAYVVGDRVKNGGKVYQCITAGTSAGSGGPSGTALDITDGTAHWAHLGTGDGAVDVAAAAETTGPTIGNTRTITVIATPVSGWSNVTNLIDALLGTNTETDAALRVRRLELLRLTGASTVEAIRADLQDLTGVIQALIFENVELTTDADGVPGKAFESVVQGGDDDEIRTALWLSKPAGIATHGTTSGTITDSQGFTHTIKFTRPTLKTIYVRVDVTTDPDTFPADGATQIKEKVVAYGDALRIGNDVIDSAIYSYIFQVTGVLDVTTLWISFTNPATGPGNLTIQPRELAFFDTANVTVNVS